jgi:hypothetical protein
MSGRPAARPQFLRICWEIANEEGAGWLRPPCAVTTGARLPASTRTLEAPANSVTRVTPAQAGSRAGSQVASMGTASEESHTRERHRPTARRSSASA